MDSPILDPRPEDDVTAVPPPTDPIPPAPGPAAGGPPGPDDAPARRRSLRGRLRRGSLDIQSKLLVMLLGVSIVAALVVGAVGYLNGRASLQAAATNQVTALREARITELQRSFSQFTQTVVAQSRNASVVGATKAFTAGWDDLQDRPVSDADRRKVDGWYRDTFVPQLDERSGETADADQFTPTSDAQTYLQARYTAPFADYDEAVQQDDAGDDSTWTAAHAEYQEYFRQGVVRRWLVV